MLGGKGVREGTSCDGKEALCTGRERAPNQEVPVGRLPGEGSV